MLNLADQDAFSKYFFNIPIPTIDETVVMEIA